MKNFNIEEFEFENAKPIVDEFGQWNERDWKGKTWLVDPDGYVFISNGAAETFCRIPCRTNGIESLFQKLPPDNKQFRCSVFNPNHPVASGEYADFLKHNLYLIYGENWYEEWQKHTAARLKSLGLNCVGNWSDIKFCQNMKVPHGKVSSMILMFSSKQ